MRKTIGILALLAVAGCSEENPLVGAWVDRDGQNLSIRTDGSALLVYPSAKWYSGNWKVLGDDKVQFDFKNLTDGPQNCLYRIGSDGSGKNLFIDNCALVHRYMRGQ